MLICTHLKKENNMISFQIKMKQVKEKFVTSLKEMKRSFKVKYTSGGDGDLRKMFASFKI